MITKHGFRNRSAPRISPSGALRRDSYLRSYTTTSRDRAHQPETTWAVSLPYEPLFWEIGDGDKMTWGSQMSPLFDSIWAPSYRTLWTTAKRWQLLLEAAERRRSSFHFLTVPLHKAWQIGPIRLRCSWRSNAWPNLGSPRHTTPHSKPGDP